MHDGVLEREQYRSPAADMADSLGRIVVAAQAEQAMFVSTWQERLTSKVAESNYVEELLGSPKQFSTHRSRFSVLHNYAADQTKADNVMGAATSRTVEIMDVHRREWDFFQNVYQLGKRLAEGNDDPITLMFDVDQTIADTDDSGKTFVRPAFPLVVAALREEFGERLRIGILTTRDETADQDILFADIEEDAIAKDLIIGTRQYAEDNPHLMLEELATGAVPEELMLEQLEDILRPDVLAAVRDRKLSINSVRDSDGKHEILRDLHFKYPHIRFGFIDNLPSAGVMRTDNAYLYGLWAGREVQDDLWAIHRSLLPKVLAKAGLAMAA